MKKGIVICHDELTSHFIRDSFNVETFQVCISRILSPASFVRGRANNGGANNRNDSFPSLFLKAILLVSTYFILLRFGSIYFNCFGTFLCFLNRPRFIDRVARSVNLLNLLFKNSVN